ncbi:MAG: amino acid adenylation domain-containing protein [Bacteroidales bacterium]|nr:amino acid adenylation domain-containing protein [Bacteroidales bacterium]
MSKKLTGLEIAVIGMSGRFPDADDVNTFWENLRDGRESISFLTKEELESIDKDIVNNPAFVPSKGGMLKDIDKFDANFFGYNSREATIMDPQMRIFHECVYNALEDAGCDPFRYSDMIGLYAGSEMNIDWIMKLANSSIIREYGVFESFLLANNEFLCTNISYKLNLKGPAIVVQSACSTSLVATHLACRALLMGECRIAVAGGIGINTGSSDGYLYQEGMIYSPDGHCRAFDKEAKGMVNGRGAGAVVLKRLKHAIEDNDNIHAVIIGSALNNDGNRKVGYTAPSVEGQKNSIQLALKVSQVDPSSISYIETHGTGTVLGDPIEFEALIQAYKIKEKARCAIGSVKANIGHLGAAAGITGVIKTILALKNRQIPPSINYSEPNPKIDIDNSPFYVNTKIKPWTEEVLRAGVSSFGIGGTNAHLIIEEAPVKEKSENNNEWKIINISANSEKSYKELLSKHVNFLKQNSEINLSEVSYTLLEGRRELKFRNSFICKDIQECIDNLTSDKAEKFTIVEKNKEDIVFVFPGQGSQYVGMGLEIYKTNERFRNELDSCFKIINEISGIDIKGIIYSEFAVDKTKLEGLSVDKQIISQPLLFSFEYALSKLLIELVGAPYAMIGYSLGEYVAACLSGVFSLNDALLLVVKRGELMDKMPGGIMLNIPLTEKELLPLLDKNISLAVSNGESCIVSGDENSIKIIEEKMKEMRVLCMRLGISHAGHSSMMDPILPEFRKELLKIKLGKPEIPYISSVTGNWIDANEVVKPDFWLRNLRDTVRFADGILKLIEKGKDFIEIGAGRDLSALVRRFSEGSHSVKVFSTIKHKTSNVSDQKYLYNSIKQLWLEGYKINWNELFINKNIKKISLPSYVFEKESYWIDASPRRANSYQSSPKQIAKNNNIRDWFYIPTWKKNQVNNDLYSSDFDNSSLTIFLGKDEDLFTSNLLKIINEKCKNINLIYIGDSFKVINSNIFEIDPSNPDDYKKLFSYFIENKIDFKRIFHLWNKTNSENSNSKNIQNINALGFYSILNIAKATGDLGWVNELFISVITNNVFDVFDDDLIVPEKSLIIGALKVIPQEQPNISCKCLDIDNSFDTLINNHFNTLINDLISFIDNEKIIAYRNKTRWVQIFDKLLIENNFILKTRLKENGVYFITGGLGRIGFTLADFLIEKYSAKIALLSRQVIPSSDNWEKLLSDASADIALKRRIKKIQHLQKKGQVLVVNADINNSDELRNAFLKVENAFGDISGVIHSAVNLSDNSFALAQEYSKEICESHFKTKVHGLIALEEILAEREINFCLLMSSIASIYGGLGYCAYSASNIFMDAFAKSRNKYSKTDWISVNWDGWTYKENSIDPILFIDDLAGDEIKMSLEESYQAIEIVLSNHKNGQIVHTLTDINQNIDKWIKLKSVNNDITQKDRLLIDRPNLANDYIPPTNDLEISLCKIWQSVLGINQIGIQDDFLELGGDSLKAINVISRIQKQLNKKLKLSEFFENPIVQEVAYKISNRSISNDKIVIQKAEKKEYYNLSSAQRRLYFTQEFDKESISYNETYVFRFYGALNKDILKTTFQTLVQRHEIFRTAIEIINDIPYQVIKNNVEIKINSYKCLISEIDEILEKIVIPFNFKNPPFFRVNYIELENNECLMVVDMHHIITDGISFEIFFSDFISIYNGSTTKTNYLQYKDYSEWQLTDGYLKGLKNQEKFWMEELSGELSVLNLPYDSNLNNIEKFNFGIEKFIIENETYTKIKKLLVRKGITLYMFLLSVYEIILSKLCNQKEIIIGTPVAGRETPEINSIIGFFINMILIKDTVNEEQSYNTFIEDIKKKTIKIFENQFYPFDELINKVSIERGVIRNDFIKTIFILQNANGLNNNNNNETVDGLKIISFENKNKSSKFDIEFNVAEEENRLLLSFDYNNNLFKQSTIKRYVEFYLRIVNIIIDDIDIKLSQIEIISKEERHQLLYEFNDTRFSYPKGKTVHQLFEEQVEKTPDGVSVIYDGKPMTYAELDSKAGRLAGYLLQKGYGGKQLVGIMADRSADMVVGILGVLKSGSAYLPLDADHPRERNERIVRSSGIKVLLTNILGLQQGGVEILALADGIAEGQIDADRRGSGDDLAYVIYTSGSTGEPKGVMVEHQNVVNFVFGMRKVFRMPEGSALLSLTTISFDIFGLEVYVPLLGGASVVIGSGDDQLDVSRIFRLLAEHKITVLQLTPSRLRQLLSRLGSPMQLKGVETLLVGGEEFPLQLLEEARRAFTGRIYNVYGPTETTIWSTYKEVTEGPLSIGRPIINTQVRILGAGNTLQPIGVAGELCILGDGVARGYYKNQRLTEEKFIDISNGEGELARIYRTGDLARWLPDGNIEFLGRMDSQVKIRGYRIELGEVESAILRSDAIRECVVIAREDNGEKHLCAYVVCKGGLDQQALRDQLGRLLPDYMIPSYFVTLDELPLTANGKVNRKALPAPDATAGVEYAPPSSETEVRLVETWSEVLSIPQEAISVTANFFSIGGNSLRATVLIGRMHRELGVDLPMREVFRNPTIRELALLMDIIMRGKSAQPISYVNKEIIVL